jgi:hypothetical protein
MTPAQLHILQHALGLDQYGQGTQYRNHYVCGPGHHGYDDCRALVSAGLMVERPPHELYGGDSCFTVTDAGKEAVLRESPDPPKLTRGQKRYREWLRADCGMKFGEWLRERSNV